MTIRDLLEKWTSRKAEHSRLGSLVSADALIGDVLTDLEELDRDRSTETVNLTEAATISGLHPDSISRRIRRGKLKNYGSPHRPLVRVADLPKKATPAPVLSVAKASPKAHTSANLLLDAGASRQHRG